ncbi:MAG TPA: LPS assembly protein LptD [Acidobacteriaceae bacterium]|jgi:LPS-assembly protein|nr:LPS assembly protein LptD [Acidobacteriaceae bacterium]
MIPGSPASPQIPQAPNPQTSDSQTAGTQAPDLSTIPHASPLPPEQPPQISSIDSDNPQTRHGDIGYASGNVVVTYGDHVLRADSITYDHATDIVTVEGHVELTGGANDEHITASHGIYNLRTQTGRFFDVHGSVGLFRAAAEPTIKPTNAGIATPNKTSRIPSYQTSNPFVFEGQVILKTGPTDYTIYNGWVTSCLLPHPDWQLYAGTIALNSGKAKASKSTFKLLGMPLFFFPYVTHPVDNQQRQSGLLIPELGYSSASKNTGSKGATIGEQVYLVLGRSADLTVGSIYYSLRGFAENGTFRYKGFADNFFNAHFSALQDRGFYSTGVNALGQPVTVFNNQGGEDVTASFRRQLSPNIRAVGDAEYLSSWIYREVFTSNFNQAVSTDITSILYLTQQKQGFSLDARIDRYEGLKVVQTDFSPSAEVKIYHVPSIDFTGMDHPIPGTPLLWSATASTAGLKRVEPFFATAGLTWRLDLRPEISLPLHFDGWHVLASAAVRETAYTRSREAPYGNNAVPVQSDQGLNRADLDFIVDIRPPVLERTFIVPERWRRIFGDEIRHTIEPALTYRDTIGINNFLSVLRFDDVDLASDTNELQYGVTQHLYFKPHPKPPAKPKPGCPAKPVTPTISDTTPETPPVDTLDPDERATTDANGIANASATAPDQPLRTHPRKPDPCAQPPSIPAQKEWFSWILTQKAFFNPTFGNAVIDMRRNIFETTLDFSGIAFLTQPRNISPLKSRMRFRTSSHVDIAWDFDYDTGARKFLSSNTYLDFHEGIIFGGFSYALLNAPGKNYTEVINPVTNQVTGLTTSAIADFSQMRLLFGFGKPSEPGLSTAVSAGIDLNYGSAQYVTVQTNYNWNCCGLSVEYRKYDLGTIRDEGAYSFNFTLANIGTAGNLRRAASLF